jgi:hypothetical protein
VRPESRGASHHHSVSLVPKHGACAKVTANPGVEPFDAAKAAKAMNDVNAVPDKYVTLSAKGTGTWCDQRQRGATQDLGGLR